MNDQKPASEAKFFFVGMGYFFVLLVCLALVQAFFSYIFDYTEFSYPQPPGIVGQKGSVLTDMIACPNLTDLKTLIDTSVSSSKVNDAVGISNAIDAATNSGCRVLKEGQSGLVIAMSGYYFGFTKIRLDYDNKTYWIKNKYIGTMHVPNWDVRRLIWNNRALRSLS